MKWAQLVCRERERDGDQWGNVSWPRDRLSALCYVCVTFNQLAMVYMYVDGHVITAKVIFSNYPEML